MKPNGSYDNDASFMHTIVITHTRWLIEVIPVFIVGSDVDSFEFWLTGKIWGN